jgi:hypothetical protein
MNHVGKELTDAIGALMPIEFLESLVGLSGWMPLAVLCAIVVLIAWAEVGSAVFSSSKRGRRRG